MCHVAIPTMIGLGLQLADRAMQAGDDGKAAAAAARELRQEGARKADEIRRQGERGRARQRLALLKGGVTGEGSPADLQRDLAQENARDAFWTQHGHDVAAREQERAARRARRSGILDSLTGLSRIGEEVIKLR
ncbi:hypothetical protein A8950_2334 [Dongia mobilis]|uniref:Uncharacterized protein n=2 Tax=Dongia mobilis TaxID=578943 RepID=A0A4R6WSP1_9PROT|nr:hypothetical protein A8950_2334 [Dongia mobilis]